MEFQNKTRLGPGIPESSTVQRLIQIKENYANFFENIKTEEKNKYNIKLLLIK
jgi:hypothetical protein